MKHIVIITGGYLNMDFARMYLKTLSYDKVFAVDKGLEYAEALGIIPDLLIGDFDTVDIKILSAYEKQIADKRLKVQIERHPVKKNATDTELAVDTAMKQGAEKITILAATGSRMDHVLSNIGLLLQAVQKKVKTSIVDETNRITILSANDIPTCTIRKREQYGEYVSLIPLTPKVEGVTLEGAMYPLEDATIYQSSGLTVSNQIIGERMKITIKKGQTLVIESKD